MFVPFQGTASSASSTATGSPDQAGRRADASTCCRRRTATVRTWPGRLRLPVTCTCGARTVHLGPRGTARFSLEDSLRGDGPAAHFPP
ncbi:hypothetical protein E1288_24485 [Saccharopolyspora elongata]|uniref:Uncharacterized protein n=1 Tax=Saccharopolyspora elongata TaxID=2530387 RepID=A0A4R4YHC5_9PSEU|nr:hypothetical protein E1288_24485 [Saccharopolyspora elongata]